MNSQLGVGLVVRCSPQVNATVDVLRPQEGGGGGGGQDPDPDPELIARILRMALERGVSQAQDEMTRTKQAMRSLRRSPLDEVIAGIPNVRRTMPMVPLQDRVILVRPEPWPPVPAFQNAIHHAIQNAIDLGAQPADIDAAAGAAPVLPIVEPDGPPVVDVDTDLEGPAPGPPVEADGPAPGPVPFPRGKPTVAVVIDEHTDRWTGRST